MTDGSNDQEKSDNSEPSVDLEIFAKVEITPKDGLKFEGKKEETRKRELTITNGSDKVIMFKMKGTSPGIIKISPNFGYLQTKAEEKVKVKLLPIDDSRMKTVKHEHVTVLMKIVPAKREPNAKDMWQKHGDRKSVRQVVRIKIEGIEGFEPSATGKTSESKLKTDKKKSKDKFTTNEEGEGSKTRDSDMSSSSKTDKIV